MAEIAAERMLELGTPQLAVTPGQSAVVFDGERVLGGAGSRGASGERPSLPEELPDRTAEQ